MEDLIPPNLAKLPTAWHGRNTCDSSRAKSDESQACCMAVFTPGSETNLSASSTSRARSPSRNQQIFSVGRFKDIQSMNLDQELDQREVARENHLSQILVDLASTCGHACYCCLHFGILRKLSGARKHAMQGVCLYVKPCFKSQQPPCRS